MTELINFIIFILSTVGMTMIIVDGSIFQPVKKYLDKRSLFSIIYNKIDNSTLPRLIRFFAYPIKLLGWTITILKKKILEMVNCYQCCAFWSSVIITLIFWQSGVEIISLNHDILGLLIHGCMGSLLGLTGALLIMQLQK